MGKLLSANFIRLRKDKFFWIGMVFMCVAGIFIHIMRYMDMKSFNYIGSIDSGFFTCSILIGIIAAVFCSLFIGTEFSDGTIRNKVIIGRTRISIYWSNFITCSVVSIAMCVLYFIAYL